jgi:protein TonB
MKCFLKAAVRAVIAPLAVMITLSVGVALAADDVHVSSADAIRAATAKPQPEYPPVAKQLHLEGAVEVEAHIAEDGSVDSVKPLTGNAVLMNAAVAAMKRWKFTPFTAGGKPVKAVAPMTFNFKL